MTKQTVPSDSGDSDNKRVASGMMILACAAVPLVGLYAAFVTLRRSRPRAALIYFISSMCGIILWVAWTSRH